MSSDWVETGRRRRQPLGNMWKHVDEKKWRDTYQANGVTQKPLERRRLVFVPLDVVVCNQTCDTNDCCSYSRRRTHQNIADHISSTAQPKINLRGSTQHECRRAITDSDASCAD